MLRKDSNNEEKKEEDESESVDQMSKINIFDKNGEDCNSDSATKQHRPDTTVDVQVTEGLFLDKDLTPASNPESPMKMIEID